MSDEMIEWLMKVLQPERTLASLPGGAGLGEDTHAALLGLPAAVYAAALHHLQQGATAAATELLAEPEVAARVDRLPLQKAAKVMVFGDSLTSEPQSWAVIVRQMLATRRRDDAITWTNHAFAGETTAQCLVRVGEIANVQPDWVLFLCGTNDARTQGPRATKTLVHPEETARNLAELRRRVADETAARCLFLTPPAVDEARAAAHPGLTRFGVGFRNDDLARVAAIVRDGGGPVIDLFSALGAPPPSALLMSDGLHLSLAGQRRLALEVVRGWSELA